MSDDLKELKDAIDGMKKTITTSHGEIGLGVLLAVTFTFANILIASHVWEQVPPWRGWTVYNIIISLLTCLWVVTLIYAVVTRIKPRQSDENG
jgi:uncharacterized BrkB/YihY/UPF0761 family membrane protein